MNNIKNGLWFRIIWLGFGLAVSVVSIMSFSETRNYGDLVLCLAWLLMAASWFMQPVVLKRSLKISEIISSQASYAIGSPLARISFSMIGITLLVVGLFLKHTFKY